MKKYLLIIFLLLIIGFINAESEYFTGEVYKINKDKKQIICKGDDLTPIKAGDILYICDENNKLIATVKVTKYYTIIIKTELLDGNIEAIKVKMPVYLHKSQYEEKPVIKKKELVYKEKKTPTKIAPSKTQFKIGLQGTYNSSTVDWREAPSIPLTTSMDGIGVSVKLGYAIGDWTIGVLTGYLPLMSVEGDILGVKFEASMSGIPILAFASRSIIEGLYFLIGLGAIRYSGEAKFVGITIPEVNNFYASGTIGVGYEIPVADKVEIDISFRLNGIFDPKSGIKIISEKSPLQWSTGAGWQSITIGLGVNFKL